MGVSAPERQGEGRRKGRAERRASTKLFLPFAELVVAQCEYHARATTGHDFFCAVTLTRRLCSFVAEDTARHRIRAHIQYRQ